MQMSALHSPHKIIIIKVLNDLILYVSRGRSVGKSDVEEAFLKSSECII